MAEEETLSLEEQAPKGKNKLVIIIAAVVLLLAIAGGAFFMLSGDDSADTEMANDANTPAAQMSDSNEAMSSGQAQYVALPRPFLFNLPGTKRSVLVQIKVQLMVRGSDNEVAVQKHIPLIESELLSTFSSSNVQKLSTQAGKDELRQQALVNVQNVLTPIIGRKGVEKVLFVGFVMQ
ncbi:flagellar basal body-associated protein FliL [Shewanella sp. 202IG2-18]|uniref:flagellar basal body-associated protein FliL n=1 Tax=Parashewanella hymeniacidonis TaxID=2807618 RepID=UPI001960C445|nr:flagellar basal body-associated protein FliL [Parashewanella hymeniacidonis]MBM7072226.1 flagellar basal body-associated protein FliL [Parashewanella hymeniacidonis]